ncbi:MAG: hypothetical protein J6B55_03660 [Clostridia bacterium]|nr:hypothetical protein [Clostridia bacterium]
MKKLFRKISYIVAAVICSAVSFLDSALIPVSADSASVKDYSATDILDDLSDVPVVNYPKDVNGVPEVIRFQEYCYSEKVFFDEYYGLFLYIYNPTEKALQTNGNNVVNMAVDYDTDGKPITYENIKLEYCDKTENNRFYKFKLSNSAAFLEIARSYAAAHDGVRRYDIVGIQLTHMTTADYTYEKTYSFSGYAAGCGDTTGSESTLTCTVEGLETIGLKVDHTYYRTYDYNAMTSTCDTVNMVYFGVDNAYFTDYGGLQKIKAEWDEYKSKPIFVTSDSEGYEALYPYLGVDIGESNKDLNYSVYWEKDVIVNQSIYHKQYNDDGFIGTSGAAETCNCINWLFQREATSRDDYVLTSEELEFYMSTYTSRFYTEAKAGRKYAISLFEDSIDSDRVSLLDHPEDLRGHIVQEIDAGDEQDLMVEKDQSFWDRIWNGVQYEEKGIAPIVVLDDSIRSMTVNTFASTYLINDNDKQTVYKACLEMLNNGQKPVLFRFAVTDYYASTAYFDAHSNIFFTNADGYVAQETMFFNFDIISLMFRNAAGKDTVLGVVTDPLDIIPDVEPAPDTPVSSPLLNGVISFFGGGWDDNTRGIRILLGVLVISVAALGVLLVIDFFRENTVKIVTEKKDKKDKKR